MTMDGNICEHIVLDLTLRRQSVSTWLHRQTCLRSRGKHPARSALFAVSSPELAKGFQQSQPCIVALIRHSICMRARSVRGVWRNENRLHAASAWRIFLERRRVEPCIVSSVVVSLQYDVALRNT